MAKNWYALWAKPHKELTVSKVVQTEDIDVFLPMVKVKPKNPRAAKIKPYFPGYLFIKADLDQYGANHFNWMVGAHGLVSFDKEPVVIPDIFIDKLKEKVSQIEEMGGIIPKDYEKGDVVRITTGPFAGYDAMFDMRLQGKDRVQVMLAFLSQYQQPLKLTIHDIEKKY